MEDLAQPKTVPPEVRARRTAVLAVAVGAALCVPLLSVLVRRKPIIPDQEEGYRPVAQLTGHERVTPRIRLEPPVKPREPRPPEPASKPPALSEMPRASAPEPPKRAARRKKRRPSAPASAEHAPAAFFRLLVLAGPAEPARGLDDVFWPRTTPEPANTAPAAAAPATPTEPAAAESAKSRVGGRRAAEPPQVPALEAPPPERPCPDKGAWRNAETRQCFPTRKACETDGGPCVKGAPGATNKSR